MQRLVITGGCGFIGVNLIRFLIMTVENISIRIVDNLSVGNKESLIKVCSFKEVDIENINHWETGVVLIQGDILDLTVAKRVCREAEGVVHLAANTGVIPSIEDPLMDCKNNVLGTLNYLEACRLNEVKRFVLASSGAPLGEQAPPIHEEMVAQPVSPYGASKLSGEAYCSAYFGAFDIETVCLRFGNAYGPHSEHKNSVVAKFIRQIIEGKGLTVFGDGTQTRDFIHVDDLCGAIWSSLTTKGVGGHVFQIATHKEHTVSEIADILQKTALKDGYQTNVDYAPERKGEVKRNYSDISKAQRMLGWMPKIALEEGLSQTWQWFLSGMQTSGRH